MENETIFVDGLYPREPKLEWIAASFSINIAKFDEFLKNNKERGTEGFLSIDIKKSRANNKLYATLNTYKPKEVKSKEQAPDRDDDGFPF